MNEKRDKYVILMLNLKVSKQTRSKYQTYQYIKSTK